ncbi:MAG: type IV secretory system conjugative DNA transfer family protein [Acidiferrobacterales bacterium]
MKRAHSLPASTLYHIPDVQADLTRVVWPALGLFFVITLLGFWGASEYLAWRLRWSQALGPALWGRLYAPWQGVLWSWRWDRPVYGPLVLTLFARVHAGLGATGLVALIVPVGMSYRRTRKRTAERNDLHGSAHWATDLEVAATGLLARPANAGGVYLGTWQDASGHSAYLRHAGPEHIMAFAPTRSGKGVGLVVPTLLSWPESVLVHDIKGENWHLTAGFRKTRLRQRTLKFDPTHPGSARFNPLMEIRVGTPQMVKDVQNIATMIVDPDGRGLNDHWAKTGFDLLVGVLLHVLLDPEEPDRSLARVQEILSAGDADIVDSAPPAPKAPPKETGFQAVMRAIRDRDLHPVIRQAAQSFLNKAPNEASGVLSTALSFLSLYRDPIVAANTRVSDFTLESLMQTPTSLYLVVPPSDKDRLKPLTRLIINQTVRRLTEGMDFDQDGQSQSRYPHRLLLMLDEFSSLGKLEIFQEALAFMAGYGLKAFLIVQDLTQLFGAYGQDESILSNCHIRVAFAPNKIETASLLSKMSGQATVRYTQRQYSGSRLAVLLQHVNTNEQIVERPLLTPDEALRLPADDEILFVAGHAPIYGRKIQYYADPAFKARAQVPPPGETGRGSSAPLSADTVAKTRTVRSVR